ncbi:hypothetical protein G7Y89_g13763 [Cudoniella acicularis]|uniref:Lysyl-tRNA synthetase n=1 Tax=Cudoniella acicularis TaxID=354080 RepID=A0A8H4R6A8_9HELO|nr:hypothetical protein G7Y89_g13763 [Cudoniella acicularis]
MNSPVGFRFLRPYLCKDLPVSRGAAYVRFFNRTRCVATPSLPFEEPARVAQNIQKAPRTDQRVEKLRATEALEWPRIGSNKEALSIADFCKRYTKLQPGERLKETSLVYGRIRSVRLASSKLAFVDIIEDGFVVQGVLSLKDIEGFSGTTSRQFNKFCKTVRRGDIISLSGNPHVTVKSKGELSIFCENLPTILSPALNPLPRTFEDPEARVRNRHVDMLVNRRTSDILRARSQIIQRIRNFLLDDQFTEVQTPIIADAAGGAIAKPFTTVATEFSEKQLALRIAPELWLKRIVVGGMDRVFEIGPVFRNEGLDATHNPEFTTCEFYKSYANINELMGMTEKIILRIAQLVSELKTSPLTYLPAPDPNFSITPFKRISFIPAIEEGLGQKLPDLESVSASEELVSIFKEKSIPIPASPTLPRLLDKLANVYIEPQCEAPTYIIHHPACMAPLSKSFVDNSSKQLVSARAELFIHKSEIANMYEEENSPFEQRTKFEQQAKFRDDENKAAIDESYLEALEWGLPPTGGWGCGIDRLVMLFTGSTRISDVLPFGSLRNVVNLGSPAPRVSSSKSATTTPAPEKDS